MGASCSCLPISRRSKLKHYSQELVINNAININQVSEDELLFLPGITRQLAKNLIDYRQTNHGFKEINELLQVLGITSRILKKISGDITIDAFSRSTRKRELVNLNFASYNELRSVPGLTPILSERIIAYRERKGSFHALEDLLHIEDIDIDILETIRPHVTVDQQQTSLSLATLLVETVPLEFQRQLLSSFSSTRPSASPENDNQKTFRFASWNLQQLTYDKVQNFGVREVICRIILEHNFSLIAIQEIIDPESLECIIDELNHPTIPIIKVWSTHRPGKWKCIVSGIAGHSSQEPEYFGFVYNESIGTELIKETLLPLDQHLTRLPYLTVFRMPNQMEFVFVNLYLKTRESDEAESLDLLTKTIDETVVGKGDVILSGSFNRSPTSAQFQALIKCNYSYVTDQNTDIHLQTPQGSTCTDNIWLSGDVKALRTENSGVIRDHLTNLWIPSGWQWCGFASEHCPIWVELNLL